MRFLSLLFLFLCFTSCKAQDQVSAAPGNSQNSVDERPKLVVGIVVDQMRYDYLTRFYSKYGKGGFKRLINDGFNCKNSHFNYIPTKTAAGHASIFSGTTPRYHGVIANNWFDKEIGKSVYCVSDANYMKGKTIGISIKDRGAVLPAGFSANGAYWFRGKDEGAWITSTFYMNDLPSWVKEFNGSTAAKSYLKLWNTLDPINTYTESGSDLSSYEDGFNQGEAPVKTNFPYDLLALSKFNGGYDILKSTPYGNSLTTDFAIAAIKGEQLGADDITDVLTISYSSTDYVGHNFGVNAKETQDTYLRLDKDLERLFNELDKNVGKGNYTIFLTADHGAPYVPAYLKNNKIPAALFDYKNVKTELNELLSNKFNASNLVLSISNAQVFLDHSTIDSLSLNTELIKDVLISKLLKYKHIDKVFNGSDINRFGYVNGVELLLKNGYHQKRSGDILIVLDASVFSDGHWNKKGTDHGSGYIYDTHVPLLFFGKGIKKGSTNVKTEITDIAPTISALLGISFPNASTGNVLEFVID